MKKHIIYSLTVLVYLTCSYPCGFDRSGSTKNASDFQLYKQKYFSQKKHQRNPADENNFNLPTYSSLSQQVPWGGGDTSKWRQESMMANAASMAINEASLMKDFLDVTVSAPTEMRTSKVTPYGDGQTNASPNFNYPFWKHYTLPTLAALIKLKDQLILRVYISKSPDNDMSKMEIYFENYGKFKKLVSEKNGNNNEYIYQDFSLSNETYKNLFLSTHLSKVVFLLRPVDKKNKPWNSLFPVGFYHPVKSEDFMQRELTAEQKKLLIGPTIDPLKVGIRYDKSHTTFEKLLDYKFNQDWTLDVGGTPFMPPNIHATFPENGKMVYTSTGMGWTWLIEKENKTPFKILYTCFDARHPENEINPAVKNSDVTASGTVPSGGGWHLIGDHAETIFNSLEDVPITVGFAIKNPFPKDLLKGELAGFTFAHGFTDFATIRRLRPGEALVTARGSGWSNREYKDVKERANGELIDQSQFHWFFFEYNRPVCTVEWVHPCLPKDAGFRCY
jgi:hypothetical protein